MIRAVCIVSMVCVSSLLSCLHARAAVTADDFGDMSWREVGPAVMGGRLDSVAGVAGDSNVIYLGHSSGGLYKSVDGGMTFASIFSQGGSSSIGAVAVAPSDPRVVYVGTGEGFPRNTAALGDGVWVSRNAGKTWSFAGLRDGQHVARIAIDPHDANVALVAVMGPEFSSGGVRGIYRTVDGGKHWTRVLAGNDTTGGSDVSYDGSSSSVVFAGTFDYLREPWTFRGGGPGSGLFRSSDGGKTWVRLTDPLRHDGLPGGTINRVGVGVSANHRNVVYAIVPSASGLLYRSDDSGLHWTAVNNDHDLVFRPFYFSQVRVDPDRPNRVWIVSGGLSRSLNGGKAFSDVDAGGDNHDLWIDPKHHARVLLGSDMGFDLSNDDGTTWSYVNTVPFSQIYRVGFDRDVPYHIMGGMQDHEVWWGPNSAWNDAGLDGGMWRRISDWGDGQYAQPDPLDSNIIFEDTHFGDFVRRNLLTGEARYISPQPVIGFGAGANAHPLRFNWSSPLLISPLDAHLWYVGANELLKTTDDGQSWKAISPDLTQPCDPTWLLPSGGPLGHDNTNAETYCTIYAIAQGNDVSTIWVGTDDGNLQLTRDGGATWTNLTHNIAGLPGRPIVSSIDVSRTHDGTAFVSFDRHRFGDTAPYIFRTDDFGKSWTPIADGLHEWVDVVRQDPREANLLFAGTEDGVYASFDRGVHWIDARMNLNHVPVYDLQIQPDANDLIAGTHGRGFAILDDLAPLEMLAAGNAGDIALMPPPDAWRYMSRPGIDIGQNAFVSDNKPYGASISFYVRDPKPKETANIEIVDGNGEAIRHESFAVKRGINRVNWDLTTDPPGWPNTKQDVRSYYVFYPLAIAGPEVLPGNYEVSLTMRGVTRRAPLRVRLDPSSHASPDDLRAQFVAITRLATMQERGETWIAALEAFVKAHKDDAGSRAAADAVLDRLRNGNGSENAGYRNPAQVVDQIAYLRYTLETSFSGPTDAQNALADAYEEQLDALAPAVEKILGPR